MTDKIKQNARRVIGTNARPRVSIFRSNKAVLAQVVDDARGTTLIALSTDKKSDQNPTAQAFDLGKELAKAAKEKKIKSLVFDRRNYRYHGRVKAVAEGLREGGIKV